MASTKMLQILIDGQTLIREDIKDIKVRFNKRFDELDTRIDKLGLQLARLEDDAPTIDEFDDLEKRVSKLELTSVKN